MGRYQAMTFDFFSSGFEDMTAASPKSCPRLTSKMFLTASLPHSQLSQYRLAAGSARRASNRHEDRKDAYAALQRSDTEEIRTHAVYVRLMFRTSGIFRRRTKVTELAAKQYGKKLCRV